MIKYLALITLISVLTGADLCAQKDGKPAEGTNIGDVAPEIALQNPEGKVLKLSSLRGYIVLIDFWASWCGPCRRENPTLVKAYQNYGEKKMKGAKGFRIFSVSLDKNADAWKIAIKDDKLDWKFHVSELQMWNSVVARKYKINSIPSNLLIDAKGLILAKNLRGENLLLELEKHVQY